MPLRKRRRRTRRLRECLRRVRLLKVSTSRLVDSAGIIVSVLWLAACSGGVGSTDTSSSVVTYSVGGTVSGLSGSGLVLENNGADNLVIHADGSFTFPSTLITGNKYSVSVWSQPTAPNQTCTVSQGSGTVAGAEVNNVAVDCTNKTTATDTIGGVATGVQG